MVAAAPRSTPRSSRCACCGTTGSWWLRCPSRPRRRRTHRGLHVLRVGGAATLPRSPSSRRASDARVSGTLTALHGLDAAASGALTASFRRASAAARRADLAHGRRAGRRAAGVGTPRDRHRAPLPAERRDAAVLRAGGRAGRRAGRVRAADRALSHMVIADDWLHERRGVVRRVVLRQPCSRDGGLAEVYDRGD